MVGIFTACHKQDDGRTTPTPTTAAAARRDVAEECDATPMHEFSLPRKNKKKKKKKNMNITRI